MAKLEKEVGTISNFKRNAYGICDLLNDICFARDNIFSVGARSRGLLQTSCKTINKYKQF